MNKQDAEEFTQSLGQIVGGSWRQIKLAKSLGVPKALGLSVDDWVQQRLGGYVKMTVEDRREAVRELTAEGASTREAAEVLGVDQSTVVRDMRAFDANASEPANETGESDANASPPEPDPSPRHKAALEREARNKERLTAPVHVAVDGLILGDFRELSAAIPDESVELVFTDPPYDDASAPLYADAARIAARILKPGGSLICYTGQILLPKVLPPMSAYLRYWWTAACVHDGGNQMLQKKGIRCGWKPIMWFVKGTRGDVASVIVDTVSGAREKEAHEWQQAEAEAAHFIDKLCSPAGTVVDFFAGGGTTCVAAEKLGRKWIGYEIDAKHHASASERLAQLRDKK